MQLRSVVCAPSLPTPSSIDTPAMDIGLAIALRNLPGRPSNLPQLYQDFLTEVELAGAPANADLDYTGFFLRAAFLLHP